MARCLILSCSKAKTGTGGAQPAIQRYDGPAYRVTRLFLKNADSTLLDVDLYVLSAQYGLISSNSLIDDYDQRMTHHRAIELNNQALNHLAQFLKNGYQEVFISMSKEYLQALKGYEALVPLATKIIISNKPEGKRLRELKLWLYKKVDKQINSVKPVKVTGQAVIKGKLIEATPNQVLEIAQKSLPNAKSPPFNIREWYTIIGGQKVSPKWIVSILSELDVSEFQASDARRVLAQLGISVEHV
jgi:hypothetical protein